MINHHHNHDARSAGEASDGDARAEGHWQYPTTATLERDCSTRTATYLDVIFTRTGAVQAGVEITTATGQRSV